MNIDEAKIIYPSIKNTHFSDLACSLVNSAIRYARIRVDWERSLPDLRRDTDDERTRAHNTFIDSCNILSRNMARVGEDNSWRQLLSDDRKTIGDFACYLHCLLGLKAR